MSGRGAWRRSGTAARAAEEIGYDSARASERVLVPESPADGFSGIPGLPWAGSYRGTTDPLAALTLLPALLGVLGINDADEAIAALTEFFPNSPADVDKARFVLRHILATKGAPDAPRYPSRDL